MVKGSLENVFLKKKKNFDPVDYVYRPCPALTKRCRRRFSYLEGSLLSESFSKKEREISEIKI